MKNLFKNITALIVLLLTFSCNDDFLKEEPTFVGMSTTIVISPDWDANDYFIFCPGVGNAKFSITQSPSWLNVSAPFDRFINDAAILNCKANVFNVFSEIGNVCV